VDDYEFACESLSDAERARDALQDALGEYELQLNPRKTQILELPYSLDTSWAQDLAAFQLGSTKSHVLQSQLIRYFSRAFELTKTYPGEPVLKYAVRRLSEIDCTQVAQVTQQLLFQAAVADPGTLHTALYITFEHSRKGFGVDRDAMTRALAAIIGRHSALQHGGDVAWALWGAIVFGLMFQENVIRSLQQLTDPIAVLMALFADSKGVFVRPLVRTQWESFAVGAELFDRNWLVAYEAVGQGWLPNVTTDPASSDPFFMSARQRGVQFMNPGAPLVIPAPSQVGDY
jgi:hypothetical protein